MAVYFIQEGEDGFVKIGRSKNVKKRMKSLQIGNPRPLSVVMLIPGGRSLEMTFHELFHEDRVSGEWFKPIVLCHWIPFLFGNDLRPGVTYSPFSRSYSVLIHELQFNTSRTECGVSGRDSHAKFSFLSGFGLGDATKIETATVRELTEELRPGSCREFEQAWDERVEDERRKLLAAEAAEARSWF